MYKILGIWYSVM